MLLSLDGVALRTISGLSVTEVNYPAAIKRLQARFCIPDVIIQAHVNALFHGGNSVTCAPSHPKYVEFLWTFYDEVENHIQGLATQGIKGYQTEFFLCPLILGRLPLQIRSKWCEFRHSN